MQNPCILLISFWLMCRVCRTCMWRYHDVTERTTLHVTEKIKHYHQQVDANHTTTNVPTLTLLSSFFAALSSIALGLPWLRVMVPVQLHANASSIPNNHITVYSTFRSAHHSLVSGLKRIPCAIEDTNTVLGCVQSPTKVNLTTLNPYQDKQLTLPHRPLPLRETTEFYYTPERSIDSHAPSAKMSLAIMCYSLTRTRYAYVKCPRGQGHLTNSNMCGVRTVFALLVRRQWVCYKDEHIT